jgi:hypothetical protein
MHSSLPMPSWLKLNTFLCKYTSNDEEEDDDEEEGGGRN